MKTKIGIIGLGLTFASLLSAASISWTGITIVNTGENKQFLGTGFVDYSGDEVFLYNVGPGDTVEFEGRNWTGYDMSTQAGWSSGFASGFHSADAPLTNSASFAGAGVPHTVTLGGIHTPDLLVGQEYRIQLIFMDGRNLGRSMRVDGVNYGSFSDPAGDGHGNSLLVVGTFVADATMQTFTVEGFTTATGASIGGHLNAMALHAIPEPSTYALIFGFGVLAFVAFRRFRR